MLFENREHAAELLARTLRPSFQGEHPLVLAVPRGAVPMAKVIADLLAGDLDVVLVRKLGYPSQPELAIGAIDETGTCFLSDYALEIDPDYLEAEKTRQLALLRSRRAEYTPSRSAIDASDRIAIVVDDGIATGSTMTAALRAIRRQKPKKLVAAAAVASTFAERAVKDEADAFVCLHVSAEFHAVGQFFEDFSQLSDEDVIAILQQQEGRTSAA